VIGVNTADDQTIAREFVKQNGLTYPIAVDGSDAANAALAKYETLGMSAVPMTYLIDRDGKVLDAWYGFEPGRAEAALKKIAW
jgi:peroxiredoxin